MRVGLKLEGRAAARTHMKVADAGGNAVGEVTSGAFTPTAAASIAMAYVPPASRNPARSLPSKSAARCSRPASSPCLSFPTITPAGPKQR